MFNLRLKQLRKKAGIRSQREMAAKVGEKERTYASWERGEVTMNLEQAYNVCVVLGCTLNELVGMETATREYSDPRQAELNRCWESLDPERQDRILADAHDMEAAKSLRNSSVPSSENVG